MGVTYGRKVTSEFQLRRVEPAQPEVPPQVRPREVDSRATGTARRDARDRATANAVDVVVVTYMTGPVLFDCLASVLGQERLDRLVIVDNGNPSEVVEQLSRMTAADERIRLITGHGNIGFSAACNLGARAARSRILMLLNPDCVLPAGTLRDLADIGAGKHRPWMLGCMLLNPDGSEQAGSRRKDLTVWTVIVEVLRLYRLAPEHRLFERFNQHELPLPQAICTNPVISGACMMLPLEDYWAVGGIDEGYFLHFEDVDFCYRFRRAGGTIYFVPSVRITHYRSTSAKSKHFIRYMKIKGLIRYLSKRVLGFSPF